MRAKESQFVRGLVAVAALGVVSASWADWLATAEAPLTTQTVTSSYDNYGNSLTRQVVQALRYADGHVESHTTGSTQTYLAHDLTTWIIGKPSRVSATAQLGSNTLETRVTAFEYSNVNRPWLMTAEIKEPDSPEFKAVTVYGSHDAYGHPLTQSIQADWSTDPLKRIPLRTVQTVQYDSAGISPYQVTNAPGHTTVKSYDWAIGQVTQVTDPNGLVASYQYDVYGRVTQSVNYDGTYNTVSYEWCSGGACPEVPTAVYRIITSGYRSDGVLVSPPIRQYFDMLGRSLQKRSKGFDGREQVLEQVVYNARGQVEQSAEPYFEGESINWSRIEYDALGRPVKTTGPDGSVAQLQYSGNRTTSINALGQRKTEVKNVLAKTVEVIENDGTKDIRNQYAYDSLGRLKTVTDAKGNLRSYEYDLNGNKLVDVDPGSGRWEYGYNALGELVSQRDAKGALSKIAYDNLGRMIRKEEPELISTWTYDTSPKLNGSAGTATSTVWKGMLYRVSSSNGYQRDFTYDLKGRLYYNQVTVDGQTYLHVTDYDAAGRPNTVVYPGGKGYRNVYNANGYLDQVQDVTNSAVVYWRANFANARGQVTRATLGNGLVTDRSYRYDTGTISGIVTGPGSSSGITQATIQNESYLFDPVGNLKARVNNLSGLTESFTYDPLNRLKYVAYLGGPMNGKYDSYKYDELGNLVFKSGVGALSYQAVAPSGRAIPHAVSSVAPSTLTESTQVASYTKWAILSNGGITFPIRLASTPRDAFTFTYSGNKTASYQYDENGRMTSGDGRTISWTSWGMPYQITQGGKTSTFVYTAEHERIKKTVNGCSTLYLNPRIDLGGRYELETCGTKVTERWTLYAGGGAQGEYVTVKNNGVVDNTQTGLQYFHTDHLGSVVAVTNAAGQLMSRMSYDAWGQRRNFDGTPLASMPPVPTTRGYTRHEMLDDLGLIHMNGRLYDPVLGRFVSADSVIDGLFTTQGLNQFSYVHNNPLSFVDLDGHKSLRKRLKKFAQVVFPTFYMANTKEGATTVAIAGVAAYTGGLAAGYFFGGTASLGGAVVYGATAGAVNGGLNTAVAGGDGSDVLRGALYGGVVGAASGGLSHGIGLIKDPLINAVTHGVVNGVMTELQGGSFRAGFSSGFVGAAASNFGLANSDIGIGFWGGVSSKLAGGDFAQGALSSVVAYETNCKAHVQCAQSAGRRSSSKGGKLEGLLRLPDYLSFQIDAYVFSISATFSRYGDIYVAEGVNRAYPNPDFKSLGVSISDGWMLARDAPTRSGLNNFLSGWSASAGGYALVGGAYSVNSSGQAINIGVGAGGASVSPGMVNSYKGNIFGDPAP